MRRVILFAALVPALLAAVYSASATHATGNGFDEFGYNYRSRTFVGRADGIDRNLDDTVWGDSTYANDHLVMKWSRTWDDARFHGGAWVPEAWVTNEWSGMTPGGSQSVWHYKIIWVGPELEASAYWREGGYPIWGQFEVIMDQGVDKENDFCNPNNGGHQICGIAVPNGLGG